MNNNEFINKYTSGKCLSFLDFQVVAKNMEFILKN